MANIKNKQMVLLKDIVIPAGTVLSVAPRVRTLEGDDHYECTIGLTDNTYGTLYYSMDADHEELSKYFTELK